VSALTKEYHIRAQRHHHLPALFGFKYSQISNQGMVWYSVMCRTVVMIVPMLIDWPIVRESRGVVLDSDHDWRIVALPFDKFFNYGTSLFHYTNKQC
jgi:hypothetical protein